MRALGHQTPSFFVHMLYQNTKNGQLVEFIGHHDKDWAMVNNSSGPVGYVALEDLVSYEAGKGRTGIKPEPQSAEVEVDENVLPETIIPVDNRLNLNVATAEAIAKHVKENMKLESSYQNQAISKLAISSERSLRN